MSRLEKFLNSFRIFHFVCWSFVSHSARLWEVKNLTFECKRSERKLKYLSRKSRNDSNTQKKTFLDDDDDEEEGEKFSSIKKAAEEKKDLSVNKPNKLFLLLALDCAFSSNDLRLIAGSRRNNRQLDE